MLMSWRDPENTGGESWGEKVPSSGLTDDRQAAMLTVSCTAAAKKKTEYDVQQAAAAGLPLTLFRRRPLSNPQSCPPFGRATPSHGAPMAEPPPSGDGMPPVAIAAAGQWGFGAGRWSWLPSEPARRRSHTTRRPNNARNQGGSASAFPLQVRSQRPSLLSCFVRHLILPTYTRHAPLVPPTTKHSSRPRHLGTILCPPTHRFPRSLVIASSIRPAPRPSLAHQHNNPHGLRAAIDIDAVSCPFSRPLRPSSPLLASLLNRRQVCCDGCPSPSTPVANSDAQHTRRIETRYPR